MRVRQNQHFEKDCVNFFFPLFSSPPKVRKLLTLIKLKHFVPKLIFHFIFIFDRIKNLLKKKKKSMMSASKHFDYVVQHMSFILLWNIYIEHQRKLGICIWFTIWQILSNSISLIFFLQVYMKIFNYSKRKCFFPEETSRALEFLS